MDAPRRRHPVAHRLLVRAARVRRPLGVLLTVLALVRVLGACVGLATMSGGDPELRFALLSLLGAVAVLGLGVALILPRPRGGS